MYRLEAIGETRDRLSQVEALRQSIAKQGVRPPKGIRIGARRFRTAEHILEERQRLLHHRTVVEHTPSIKEQLIQLRDAAEKGLKPGMNKYDPEGYAELSLQKVWAESKLNQDHEVEFGQKVEKLLQRLHLQRNNFWLSHVVSTDDAGNLTLRHQQIQQQLEALLTKPAC